MNAQQQRLEALQNKLVSLNARFIAKTTGPDKGPMDWYTVPGGQTIIVHIYAHGEGYEVYAPVAGASLSVQETFDALDRIAASNPQPLSVDRPQPTASDRGTAAGILADPLWTAYDAEAAEQPHDEGCDCCVCCGLRSSPFLEIG